MHVVWHYSAGPSLLRAAWPRSGATSCTVSVCPPSEPARFASLLGSVEVIWHLLEPVTSADDGGRLPQLRLVQKIGVGVNTIDLEAARARGIAVCNMPETNSQAVAEMTLLLMLATLRRLHQLHPATVQGQGLGRPDTVAGAHGRGIAGRTVGLVGYGAVPQTAGPDADRPGALAYPLHEPHAPSPEPSERLVHRSRRCSRRVTSSPCTSR